MDYVNTRKILEENSKELAAYGIKNVAFIRTYDENGFMDAYDFEIAIELHPHMRFEENYINLQEFLRDLLGEINLEISQNNESQSSADAFGLLTCKKQLGGNFNECN